MNCKSNVVTQKTIIILLDVAEEALYRSVATDNDEIDYENTKILLGEIDPCDEEEKLLEM